MQTIIVFILSFIANLAGYAQSLPEEAHAIINDPDGFVNVRKEKNVKSSIKGKIYKDDIVTCYPDKSDWWRVLNLSLNKGKDSKWDEGYVHKSRITLLFNWIGVNKRNVYKDSTVFKNDSLLIIVKKAVFYPNKHKLLRKSQDELLIDGRSFYGTDGPIPKQVIAAVKVTINGQQVFIPKNAYDDLYEPNLETLGVAFGAEKTIYILMSNSDGAGGYYIIWVIKNNKFYKRFVDTSDAQLL